MASAKSSIQKYSSQGYCTLSYSYQHTKKIDIVLETTAIQESC